MKILKYIIFFSIVNTFACNVEYSGIFKNLVKISQQGQLEIKHLTEELIIAEEHQNKEEIEQLKGLIISKQNEIIATLEDEIKQSKYSIPFVHKASQELILINEVSINAVKWSDAENKAQLHLKAEFMAKSQIKNAAVVFLFINSNKQVIANRKFDYIAKPRKINGKLLPIRVLNVGEYGYLEGNIVIDQLNNLHHIIIK